MFANFPNLMQRIIRARSSRPEAARESNRLEFQALESRQLRAVDILYDGGLDSLTMTSDSASDSVEVVRRDSKLVVNVNGVAQWNRTHTDVFNPVTSLHFVGNDGSDFFRNWTQIRSTASGGNGADTLIGGGGTDTLDGGDGMDTLRGGASTDYLWGGVGNDNLRGESGVDHLWGQGDMDTLYGGSGNDFLYGGSGNDVLEGGVGSDLLNGGSGSDTFNFVSYTSGWTSFHLGEDTIQDSSGTDSVDFTHLHRGAQLDLARSGLQQVNPQLGISITAGTSLEVVRGSDHDDIIRGNNAANILDGRGGNDRIYGRSGNDTIWGGTGDDGLYGGGDYDVLWGGYGDDLFMRGPADTDTFVDYSRSDDARVVFRNGAAVSNMSFAGRDPNARWDFAAGSWTDSGIEEVDGGLANLQAATGNTRLLKRANDLMGDNPLTYIMQGAGTQVAGPRDSWGIGGWNSNGDVYFVSNANLDTVYHEVGHNWDQAGEIGSARRAEWEGISGWVQRSTSPGTTHIASLGVGDMWWHRRDAAFAGNYARVNPEEDMGSTFEAYFIRTGNNAVNGTGGSIGAAGSVTAMNIPLKIAFLDRLFASLR